MKNFVSDFMIWDEVCIKILQVKHGLLKGKQAFYLFENSLFLFVAGKNGSVRIGEDPYEITSNRLFHIAPDQEIRLSSEKEETEYFLIVYQPEFVQSVGREMLRLEVRKSPFNRCVALKVSDQFFFQEQFSGMADSWNQSPQQILELKKFFYSIANKFYEELGKQKKSRREEIDIFEKTSQYLRENFSKPVSIQELADLAGVSRITLYEKFRSHLGCGPREYLMQIRLEEAGRMLVENEMSLNDIAVCCGLRDKNYFSRIFRQRYGMPPGEYRREKRDKVSADGRILPEKDDMIATNRSQTFNVEKETEGSFSINKTSYEDRAYLVIENFGRIHRYYEIPRRIVCLDYAAAEFCAALDMADRIVGVASAETALSDCVKKYRDTISRLPFIYGRSSKINVPDFPSVRAFQPDLVIGTAYSFCNPMGVASAETFEQFGIHIYALQGTCMIGSTYREVYQDLENLGRIFRREKQAEALIEKMRHRESELEARYGSQNPPVRVFVFDASADDMAFTCGQSIETHMIHSAGGINVFGDRKSQFVSVPWSEVAEANPEAILVHRFYEGRDDLQKIALLKRISEIQEVDAIKNDRIFTIGIKKVFPAIDNLETAFELSTWFEKIHKN